MYFIEVGIPFPWAGSKAKITKDLFAHFPDADTYIEPFLGSGVALLRLIQLGKYKRYIVNDLNNGIVSFYKALQKDRVSVIADIRKVVEEYNALVGYDARKAYFMECREVFNKDRTRYDCFWLIMKAGFNGKYVENRQGDCRANFGFDDDVRLDHRLLMSIAILVRDVEFYNMDCYEFIDMVNAREGVGSKFMYCDPPYVQSQSYTKGGFDNKRLAESLADVDYPVVISDVDSEGSRLVYAKYSQIHIAEVRRTLNLTNVHFVDEIVYVNKKYSEVV